MIDSVERIFHLFDDYQSLKYGEEVTVLAHSLQCAQLASNDGQSDHLVIACLLHDIGHLLHLENGEYSEFEDDGHERRGADFLESSFPIDVYEVVRAHVDAKRYLCTESRRYYQSLSQASKISFHQQGGMMNLDEKEEFFYSAWSHDAILLRQYDDRAKQPSMKTASLASYDSLLRELSGCSFKMIA